jgi:prevent-host-death family protein
MNLTEFCTELYPTAIGGTLVAISSKDIISLTHARTKLTELCEEVHTKGREKIITKNGESCAALIDANRLDHYHRLEREHLHLTLLEEALRGIEELAEGKTLTLSQLKTRHGR